MSEPRRKELGQIRRAAAVVELRLRVARGVRVLPTALTAGLAVVACTVAVRKALPLVLGNRRAWEIVLAAAAAPVVAFVVAALRRLPARAGTVALDRHHGLADRLTNAVAFDEAKERTPLMEVAIDDACEHADRLSPRKAAPIPVPRDLLGSAAVAAGVAAVALLYVPAKPPPVTPQQKTIDAVALSPDDVELFRDASRQLTKKEQSPEVKAAIDKFNQLIEDLANKRLDRTEAFRRMEEIERELMTGAEADAKSFEEALKQTAEELKKADLSKPLGESLEKKDLEKAKRDLKDLAASFKSGKKPDKGQIDRLQKALEKAAKTKKEALEAINEKRNEIKEQLLAKKKKDASPDAGAPDPEEDRLLKKKERELERLDREAERQEQAQRRLDRLDRELSRAAEDLMRDMGLSAEDLEQAAEDINRMQEEQMSDKEKEELRQRLEELRELLRQQGQGGKERMKRMLRFAKRAHGSGGKGQGQRGQGDQGEDQDDGDGDGKDGQSQGKDGKDGQGGELVLGQGGQKVLMLTKGGGSGQQGEAPGMPGGGESGGQSGQGPDGEGAPGKGIGTTHDPNLTGKRTDLKSGTSDVEEQGLDTKQGPSNSEVILSAAERGFKGSGYKKVFTQYHTVAEQEINKDQVPDGYRFYVHRYFQLIRPRE